MRILHSSDWHLGKRLVNKSRIDEQRQALSEICEICDRESIDVVLIAGDIFDTYVPTAEAEELFFESVLKMSQNRVVVAIAGNHDDPDRMCAPSSIAKASNIILVGGLDNTRLSNRGIEGGNGYIRIDRNGEILNLALLPFLSMSRLDKLTSAEGETYADKIKNIFARCSECFTDGGINVLMAHLFMNGSQTSDENELGTAVILPKEILPESAVYTALGHIHKPQTVSKSRRIHYSGSLLNYSFDDSSQKRVMIIDTDGKETTISSIPLTSGKRTIRITAHSMDEAEQLLKQSAGTYAELTYESSIPLKPSDMAILKTYDCFAKLNIINQTVKKTIIDRISRTPSEIFSAFYEHKYGEKPDAETAGLFIKVFNGEDI